MGYALPKEKSVARLVEKKFPERIKFKDGQYHVVNPIGKILYSHVQKNKCVSFLISGVRG